LSVPPCFLLSHNKFLVQPAALPPLLGVCGPRLPVFSSFRPQWFSRNPVPILGRQIVIALRYNDLPPSGFVAGFYVSLRLFLSRRSLSCHHVVTFRRLGFKFFFDSPFLSFYFLPPACFPPEAFMYFRLPSYLFRLFPHRPATNSGPQSVTFLHHFFE